MSNRLAKILSYALHPVIYPLIGTLITLKALPFYVNQKVMLLTLAFVFTGTYIFPVAISFFLYRLKLISSLEMKLAKDRKWPYLVGAISYYFTASSIQNFGLPRESHLFILASALIIVLHLFMLAFNKPSAHLAGIGGFTGLLIALSLKFQIGFLPYIALCILLSGFLGSARLTLKAHNHRELGLGYFSGLLIVFLVVFAG